MRTSAICQGIRSRTSAFILQDRRLFHIFALFFLIALIWLAFDPVHADTMDHTKPTVDSGCSHFTFSPDGNPFPLCPGPFPTTGGNCVWWGWEQWHLLGYNLPLNWGNAAEWAIDAERFGLPVGTTPRLGSIAVFPVADGVWAFGTAGHVAFVTWVSPDGLTFNVTYQNYGDTTPMFTGTGYSVPVINEPHFQNGQLRFIYFPQTIDPKLFANLPGVNGNGVAEVGSANGLLGTNAGITSTGSTTNPTPPDGSLSSSRIALGLPPGSFDQEFSADFTGSGSSDLLLYNRQQGSLDLLTLSNNYLRNFPRVVHNRPAVDPEDPLAPYRVNLQDATTPANGWGSNLDIHIGDFTGSGRAEILLYDRVSGQIQLLSMTPQYTIAKHLTFPGWGTNWEIYVGQFDGQHSDLFMYNRFAVPDQSASQPPPGSTPTPPTSSPPGTTPTPGSTPTPSPTPGSTPTPTPTPSPTPTGSPTPTPSPTPTGSPTPTPSPTPTGSPTPTPSPTPSPTPTPMPSPTPSPTPTPMPSPTPSPTPTPMPTTTIRATPTPTPASTRTAGVQPTSAPGAGSSGNPVVKDPNSTTTATVGRDLSGVTPADWESQGKTANVLLVSFKSDFSLRYTQEYTLWHDSWEVYIGRFVNQHQDGLFLYDRTAGEARVASFDGKLALDKFQLVHNLAGNFDIHTGDFSGQGRAQVLLYDPGSGNAQLLLLNPDLSLANEISYSGWGANMVLYVGHFGLPSLSIMLYDQQAGQSTFIAFDSALNVTHQYTVQSWDQNWQILIGSFLDRSRCLSVHACATGDDVLVLNRQSGKVEQFIFSFGNQFKVFDNRVQAFLREGLATTANMRSVDASSFSLGAVLDARIGGEELY